MSMAGSTGRWVNRSSRRESSMETDSIGRQRGQKGRPLSALRRASRVLSGRPHGDLPSGEPATAIELVEGMQFDKGYISPYMVTNAQRMEAVLEDPYILITDKKISAIADLLPILEKVVQSGKPLLTIAEDVEGEALATLIVNKLRGTFNAVAVKAPGFGDRRKAMLQDIAILTGGQVISEEVGLKLDSAQINSLGRCRSVTITKDDTTLVEGNGSKDAVKGRIEQIKAEIDKSTSDWDKEKLQERLAKLSGGVAVIKV